MKSENKIYPTTWKLDSDASVWTVTLSDTEQGAFFLKCVDDEANGEVCFFADEWEDICKLVKTAIKAEAALLKEEK